MKPWIFAFLLVFIALLFGQLMSDRAEPGVSNTEWSIQAAYMDACCCAPACPCLFGSAPTLGFCEGVTLINIDKASFEDVILDDVKVLAVYRGGNWIKFYVDESASAEQTKAVVKFLPTFEKFFAIENVVEVQNVPISIEQAEGSFKVSTPNTTAHIQMMRGQNGETISIANLPAPSFPAPPFLDHVQYKTILLKHESEQETFEHSGTNGFTAKIKVNSSEAH